MSRSMTWTIFSNLLPKSHSGTRNLFLSRTVMNGNRLSIFRLIAYVRLSVCSSPMWRNIVTNPNVRLSVSFVSQRGVTNPNSHPIIFISPAGNWHKSASFASSTRSHGPTVGAALLFYNKILMHMSQPTTSPFSLALHQNFHQSHTVACGTSPSAGVTHAYHIDQRFTIHFRSIIKYS